MHTLLVDIPTECNYCKKKVTKFIQITIRHVWKPHYQFQAFTCKEHTDKAELEARREI